MLSKPTRVLPLIAASLLAACASNLSEDEVLEREYRAVELRESIREFVAQCQSQSRVVVYDGPTTLKLRDPVRYIPRRAMLSDYGCVNGSDVTRQMRGMGFGR